ncbi:hypothetical protein TNIN_52151 [Trichonephila inaurata madagascariensis]|uniref:Uncharacterized protein n=1 Tax=Trichonephila inaurata madagascariensis TaxID=2747483 RepID=A0A8X7CHA2_9ARAC|nr:hypothetical protein TNIN_52151 [Trichonephila inaurata madagascariensis]
MSGNARPVISNHLPLPSKRTGTRTSRRWTGRAVFKNNGIPLCISTIRSSKSRLHQGLVPSEGMESTGVGRMGSCCWRGDGRKRIVHLLHQESLRLIFVLGLPPPPPLLGIARKRESLLIVGLEKCHAFIG